MMLWRHVMDRLVFLLLLLLFSSERRNGAIRSGGGSRRPSVSACRDVIPAQLINSIIPSAAAPLKGMTGSHEGSARNINIYGSVRGLKAKLTALASLTLRPAMIHRASRKTDIQYLHGAPLLPLIAELCFYSISILFTSCHPAGSKRDIFLTRQRWLQMARASASSSSSSLPVSFSILQTFNES